MEAVLVCLGLAFVVIAVSNLITGGDGKRANQKTIGVKMSNGKNETWTDWSNTEEGGMYEAHKSVAMCTASRPCGGEVPATGSNGRDVWHARAATNSPSREAWAEQQRASQREWERGREAQRSDAPQEAPYEWNEAERMADWERALSGRVVLGDDDEQPRR